MDSDNYYLVFDLKTLVYIVDDNVLIYNTLTGESIESFNNQYIANLLSQSVCKLTAIDFLHQELNELIDKVQALKVGKLVNSSLFRELPLNTLPYQPISTIRNNEIISIRDLGDYYADYQHVDTTFSFYINNECGLNCIFCEKAFKQFTCCNSSNDRKSEISLNEIEAFLKFPIYHVEKILIVSGGNMFRHSQLNEIVLFFNSLPNIKKYVINCLHINRSIDLSTFSEHLSCFEIIVSMDIQFALIEKAKAILDMSKIKYSFVFIVSSNPDIESAEIIVQKLQISSYELKPYYTGSNIGFFEENLFSDKEDILSSKVNFTKVLRNKLLNENYFSSLALMSNGEIYSNLNAKSVGVLNDDWPDILNEIEKEGSWFLNRSRIEPCNKCTYALLCLSPGNYENVIGRNNLCKIKLNNYKQVIRE